MEVEKSKIKFRFSSVTACRVFNEQCSVENEVVKVKEANVNGSLIKYKNGSLF